MFDPTAVGEVPNGRLPDSGLLCYLKYVYSRSVKRSVPSFPDEGKPFVEVRYIKDRKGDHLIYMMVPKTRREALQAFGIISNPIIDEEFLITIEGRPHEPA